MNKSSLDSQMIGAFLFAMVALFASLAFEANRNGMTDPVVAVRSTPTTAVAQTQPVVAEPAQLVAAATTTR